MNTMKLKIMLDPGAFMPTRAHEADGGLDLYAMESTHIFPHGYSMVDTGVHVDIPAGYVGLLTSKSGLMLKHGLTTRGTIDSGYTGSIKAIIFNQSYEPICVEKGDKVTQLLLVPCLTPELQVVDHMDDTERGADGFGSTGM